MFQNLFEFSWSVHTRGYRWLVEEALGGEPSREPLLVPQDEFGTWTRLHPSYPLRDRPDLFRTFADTDPTEDGILQFANEHGTLGSPAWDEQIYYRSCKTPPFVKVTAERSSYWRGQILQMRRLLRLSDYIREGNVSELKKYIRWDSDGERVWYCDEAEGLIETISDGINNPVAKQVPKGNVTKPARFYLQETINLQLVHCQISARLRMTEESDGLGMYFVPGNLIAALWVQFAQSLDGARRFRKCTECETWFELTKELRADAKFCSNACRSKAHRGRRMRAKELEATGLKPREIAERLTSTVDTVRGWLKK